MFTVDVKQQIKIVQADKPWNNYYITVTLTKEDSFVSVNECSVVKSYLNSAEQKVSCGPIVKAVVRRSSIVRRSS